MAQITGGEVSYTERANTGEYEHKQATATLKFAVAEGEDYAVVADQCQTEVVLRVQGMIGKAPAPLAKTAPQTKPAAKKAEEKKPEAPSDEAIPDPAAEAKIEPAQNVPVGPEDMGVIDPAIEGAREITDKELGEHVTKHNARIKRPHDIKKLLAKHGDGTVRGVVQANRHLFVKELEAIAA